MNNEESVNEILFDSPIIGGTTAYYDAKARILQLLSSKDAEIEKWKGYYSDTHDTLQAAEMEVESLKKEIQQLREKFQFCSDWIRKKKWKDGMTLLIQKIQIQQLKDELTQMANTSRHTETQLRHKINELESKGATREQIEKTIDYMGETDYNVFTGGKPVPIKGLTSWHNRKSEYLLQFP